MNPISLRFQSVMGPDYETILVPAPRFLFNINPVFLKKTNGCQ